jgi:putative transposase
LRRQGQDHVMSDERILCDSDFVASVFSQSDEIYEHRYELISRGYDLDRIAERIAAIYEMAPRDVLPKGRQQQKVKARSLFCFWAVRELGVSLRELSRQLDMSPPGVGFSVERGEAIAHENGYGLID